MTTLAAPLKPKLGMIRAVTVTAADLAAVETAYAECFGYVVQSISVINDMQAASWGAPAAAGRRMLTMAPQSKARTLLRFVEWASPPDHQPFVTHGWNGLELIIQDPDRLAEQIESSPFFILTSQPHGIDTYPYLRACQAQGPAGEHLNLTRIDPPRPDLATAESFVDRCFIVTLGGPSIAALRDFYGRFDNIIGDVRQVRLKMMNRLCGLDIETRHPLATITLAGGTKLEIDECPANARPRGNGPGGLPWGVAIVSLACDTIEPLLADALGPVLDSPDGRSVTLRGAACELLELFEEAC